MTVCQFFLQGRCRYGQNCRFEHSYNSDDSNNRNTQQLSNVVKQIVGEIILAEKGGQWPLSCFSPVKEGTNIPGFEDVSPEEVRWKMYEARAKGTLNQAINEIRQLYNNAEKMRNVLKQPTMERVNLIVNALKGRKDAPNASNPFATSTPSAGIFGGSNTQKNIFGNTTQSTGSIFGSSAQPTVTQGNVFGGSTTPQGNVFGGVSSNFSNQNIFGGSSSPTAFNQNIFSQPQTQNQNIFSNSTATGSGNLFSNTNQNVFPNTAHSNTQGSVPNAFAAPNSPVFQNQGASSPVFGQNAFFQNSGNTTQNVFGGSQTDNVFKSQTSFGGGSTANTLSPQQSSGNVFGVQAQSTFTASQSKPNALDPSIYSKVENLTEEEIKLFTAPTFTFGKIPLKPPAQEYC